MPRDTTPDPQYPSLPVDFLAAPPRRKPVFARSVDDILDAPAPRSLSDALDAWPYRERAHESPRDWRDEVFYFLLPDRFSDGRESDATLLRADLSTPAGLAAVRAARGEGFRWDRWATSGASRFQGGTLRGVASKLDYLEGLGVTTIWLAPVFRQRVEEDSYHGYGIQNFLDVDPRFGTRKDLVHLVEQAHERGMRVVLDVIFNHTGTNFLYDPSAGDVWQPPYRPSGHYEPIHPRRGTGEPMGDLGPFGLDDYVLPDELKGAASYVRAGTGNLGAGDVGDPNAEHKRTDFMSLRKLALDVPETMRSLLLAYQYWIALADVDGFRIDTFKHVTEEQARSFCNGIKEYAELLGKEDFFLVAEIAGGNAVQTRYLGVTGRNLNACLDIGEQREALCDVAKGILAPATFFAGFDYDDRGMGSHRNWGSHHLSILNDHDHVFGAKVRFAADAANDHQAVVGLALQLFCLGIPCLYYGTEQGLASGAEADQRQYLAWSGSDWLLREAMFGPAHPRRSGFRGAQPDDAFDPDLPGFGPHGTSGKHAFDVDHPIYRRAAALARLRRDHKPLRRGRQYPRPTSAPGGAFATPGPGELFAWSRVFDDQEVMVVVNPHGKEARGGWVLVDPALASEGLMVLGGTDEGAFPSKQVLPIQRDASGASYVDVAGLGPAEVLVLANRNAVEAHGARWPAP